MPCDNAVAEDHELHSWDRPSAMEEEETAGYRAAREGPTLNGMDHEHGHEYEHEHLNNDDDQPTEPKDTSTAQLNRRTVRKLDFILLPFLALLFLLNSLDKSNIGNAETAGFTHDAGLSPSDLNTALAFFFAFFVALQPLGAALGRKYGMARLVPACMSLWGLSTVLHIWVRSKWQLICLRVAIATLEAGFYPTTVSYLSLFYTRYEFAVRLGIFYGQTAVAGALGGVLSWAVFSRFPEPPSGPQLPPSELTARTDADGDVSGGWKSWEVLFLIEGCMTIVIALVGFFWLPHSADTAWFFTAQERRWAEQRIKLDRDSLSQGRKRRASAAVHHTMHNEDEEQTPARADVDDENDNNGLGDEAHHQLLDGHIGGSLSRDRRFSTISLTADAGLTRTDILSAFLQYKIWHLLICNILSAIPATAFSVFLPLVIKQLSPSLHLSPAASNLLAAPPFVCGAITLYLFTRWSDHSRQRLVPILGGVGLLLTGLTMTVMASTSSNYTLRYVSLCILLSGSFIASPLTVAWLTNNTPEPGKRAILLGINGWGNLAGVFSAILFTPEDAKDGYIRPFVVTLVCVLASLAGFIAFWVALVRENKWREEVTGAWTEREREREEVLGDVAGVPESGVETMRRRMGVDALARRLGLEDGRRGDEKLTFRYGL